MSKNTDLAQYNTTLPVANLTATGTISVGSNVVVNTSTIFVGNSTVNSVHNSSSISVGSLTVNSSGITTNTFQVGTGTYFAVSGNVGIGTTSPNATFQVGSTNVQYSPKIGIRVAGNQIEFGHGNQSGYGSVLGSEVGSGSPFLAFNSGAGTNNNTYKTLGNPGYVIRTDNNGSLIFGKISTANADNQSVTEHMRIDSSGNVGIGNSAPGDKLVVAGNVTPSSSNTYDLGSSTLRWRNIYTNDLNLNNGIGDYTVVEGENDLYLYNNKKGKVYKFALIEVDPSEAPKKAQ